MKTAKLHEDYTKWHYKFAIAWVLEAPTEVLKPKLPKELQILEIRPGVSTLFISLLDFKPGNYNCEAPCKELSVSIQVLPELGLCEATPRYAVYTISLGSDDKNFLTSDYSIDKLPAYDDTLSFDVDYSKFRVQCYDSQNKPVFDLSNTHQDPKFAMEDIFFQVFSEKEGKLYHGGAMMKGNIFLHQDNPSSAGRLYPHPVFRGINVEDIDLQETFMQLLMEPGSDGEEIYFRLRPWAAI